MLGPRPKRAGTSRRLRTERRLWSDSEHQQLSLGCTTCPDLGTCGGLHVESRLYDCLGFCCDEPATCDSVCRHNPRMFVNRLREIDGFLLDNVPRAPVLETPSLPFVVPMIFHGSKRHGPFAGSTAVCLPLYKVIRRYGVKHRYANRLQLSKGFKIPPGATLILTGTATDPPLERWWALGSQQRLKVIHTLQRLGVTLVTTPNFSLFSDQPRWDDLHSMKRIAIVHAEFLDSGLPAALHVNARTDQDWIRWRNYVAMRPEVTHIAFEFATGSGRADRILWHADQLAQLAAAVGRPVHLVLRGGLRVAPRLEREFSGITFLETSAFSKAMRRQQAILMPNGRVTWHSSPTKPDAPLDGLLENNWQVLSEYFARHCQLDSHSLWTAA